MTPQYSSSSPVVPRIVVVSDNASHPRHHRRVEALLQAGYRVTVYTFERQYCWNFTFPTAAEVVSLGQVLDRHYFNRLPKIMRAVLRIWSNERGRPHASLLYAFGLDGAILGYLVAKHVGALAYEVGDLRNPTPEKTLFGRLVQVFEDALLARCSLLVTTSPSFLEVFFKKRCPSIANRTLIVENKLSATYVATVQRPSIRLTSEPVRIGYVGVLRYERTFNPLLKAVSQRRSRYELHIHGDGILRPLAEASAVENPNIHYHGPFRNPEDLADMYRSLDICYVVYDNSDLNVRLALPSKLYQCTYFVVPMVVAAETALWERMRAWGVGWAVDPRDEGFLDDFLDALSPKEIDRAKGNTAAVEEDLLVEDYGRLLDWIRKVTTECS